MFTRKMRNWGTVLGAVVVALIASQTLAVDYAWDQGGTGGSGNWATDLNWDANTVPNGNAVGNVAWVSGVSNNAWIGYAPSQAGGTITLNAGVTAGSLNFGTTGYIINTGVNTLQLNAVGTGTGTINFSGVGGLTLKNDGDGTGNIESINFRENVLLGSNAGTITVDRSTSAGANKTQQLGDLSIGAYTLTVTNNNTCGLEFTGTTTLTGAGTFNVANATTVTAVRGLTLSGRVTGSNGFTVNGNGTLALTNNSTVVGTANDFVGNITITKGSLLVTSDAAMGNSANQILINTAGTGNSGTSLIADGTFSTSRTINLNATTAGNNNIAVTQGNTFTVNTAFGLGAVSNRLDKNDNGILLLTAANTSWTGEMRVNAGALRVSSNDALGTVAGITNVDNANAGGAALQLNGVTTSEPLTISNTGINTGGALQAVGGVASTLSGAITLANNATIGADNTGTASTLNINAQISGAKPLTIAGAGNTTLNSALNSNVSSIAKINGGTLTFAVDNTVNSAAITVNAGTMTYSGASGRSGGNVTLNPGAILTIDNTAANPSTANRLNGKTLGLSGATFNFTANSAGSSESIGAWTLNAGATSISVTPGSNGAQITAANFAKNAGGQLYIADSGIGGVANYIKLTAAPTQTGNGGAAGNYNVSILPYTVISDGTNPVGFATNTGTANNDGLKGLRALTSAEYFNALNPTVALTTAGLSSNNLNVALTASKAAQRDTTVNSLILGNTGAVTGATLSVTSGGIISKTGNAGISSNFLTANNGTNELSIHTLDAANFNISAIITGTGGLAKDGSGNLTLSAANWYTGQTTINAGTVTLSGGNNRLWVNQVLMVNTGGTLDLNGNNQLVNYLVSQGSVTDSGGIITSASAGTLTVNQDATDRTFAGSFQGLANLVKAGGSGKTLTLSGDSSTTGAINLIGGTTSLIDGGKFSGATGSINLKFATLNISNLGTMDLGDRIANGKTINLDGSTLNYYARAQTNSTETLGAVTLASGLSTINVATGGTGVYSAQLTLTSLARNTGAMVNLTGTNLGQLGNNSRLILSSAPSRTGGIIPGVVSAGTDLVGYSSSVGVGALGTGGFPAYSAAASLAAAGTTDNYKVTALQAVATGGQTINALTDTGAFNVTFANATDALTLTSGMFVKSGASGWMGGSAGSGVLRTTASELFVYNGANTLTVYSAIGKTGDTFKTVFAGGGTAISLNNNAANVYGETVVDNTTVTLNGSASTSLIPGDLTLNAGTVTMVANAQQIASSSNVVLNGSSTLTLVGANSLASVTFNSFGGTGTPTLTIPAAATQTITTVTSASDNVAVTPTISAGGASAVLNAKSMVLSSTTGGPALSLGGNVTLNLAPVSSAGGYIDVTSGNAWLNLSTASTTIANIDHLDFASAARDVKFTGAGTLVVANTPTNLPATATNASLTLAGPTVTLVNGITPAAGQMAFGVLGGSTGTPATNLKLVLGGTSGIGTTAGSIYTIKSDQATAATVTMQQNLVADLGSSTININSFTASAAPSNLSIAGTTTINKGATLGFGGGNGNNIYNFVTLAGNVTNNGTLQSNGTNFNGITITGTYTGNGSDVLYPDSARMTGFYDNSVPSVFHPQPLDGTLFAGNPTINQPNVNGGITFQNNSVNNVGSVQLAKNQSGGLLVADGSGTVVNIKNSITLRQNQNSGMLMTRNGGSIFIDANAQYIRDTGGNNNNTSLLLSGDGKGGVIDFGNGANNSSNTGGSSNPYLTPLGNIDLGIWTDNTKNSYNGAKLVIGAVNLVTHSDQFTTGGQGGMIWSNMAPDDDGLKVGNVAKTVTGGWTVKDNYLKVLGTNAVAFSASRFIEVQSSGMEIQAPVTLAAGKSLYKWGTGDLKLSGTFNNGGQNGTLVINQGKVIANNGVLNTAVQINGGTLEGAVSTVSTLGSLTIGGSGSMNTSAATAGAVWTVAGDMTLSSGATLNFRVGSVVDTINVNGALNVNNADTYNIGFTGGFTGTQYLYPLINPVSQTNSGSTWNVTAGLPAGTYLDSSGAFGNGLYLVNNNAANLSEWARTGAGASSGNWNLAGNWTAGIPNAQNAIALLGANASDDPTTVTVDVAAKVGTLYFRNAKSYTVDTTSNALTIDTSSGNGLVWALQGSHTISGGLGLVLNSNTDLKASPGAGLSVANISGTGKNITATGAITLSGSNNTFSGTTTVVSGATTLTGALVNTPTVTVSSGAILNLNTGAALSAYPDVTANGSVNVNSSVRLGTVTGSGTVTTAGGVTLTLGRNLAADSTSALTFAGSGDLVKEGGNSITITNVGNSQFNSITVNAGMLVDGRTTVTGNPGRVDALRSASDIVVNTGGTLGLWTDIGVAHFAQNISGTGGKVRIMALGVQNMQLEGNNSYTGGTELEPATGVSGNTSGTSGSLHGTITGLGPAMSSAGIGISSDTPFTYDGQLNGALNVTFSKAGSALAPNITLASSNSMTGSLTIGDNNGYVTVKVPAGALTNLATMTGFSVGNNSRLQLNESGTFDRPVSGGTNSVFEMHGSGALDVTAANIGTNAVAVTAGTLTGSVNPGGLTGFTSNNQGTSTLSLQVDATLNLNQTGSINLTGAITGAGTGVINYTQNAGSTLTISSNSSAYQGDLTVNQGTVRINATATIPGALNVKTYTGIASTLTADGPTTIASELVVANINASNTLTVGGAVTATNSISLANHASLPATAGMLGAGGAVTATSGSITMAGTSSMASGLGTGVSAGTSISVNGTSSLYSNLNVTAGTDITVAGTMTAVTSVTATVGSITTNGTGTLNTGFAANVSAGTNINVNGTSVLTSGGSVTAGSGAISVAGTLNAAGSVAAGTSVSLTGIGTLNAPGYTLTAPTGVSTAGTINMLIAGNTSTSSVVLNSTVSGIHTLGDITLSGANKGITVGLNNSLNAGAINGGLLFPPIYTDGLKRAIMAYTTHPTDFAGARTADGAESTPGKTHGWLNTDPAGNGGYAYTGQILVGSTGKLAFAEDFDDSVRIKVDGAVVLQDTAYATASASGSQSFAPGWHDFELIVANDGGGSAGPNGTWATFGVGYSTASGLTTGNTAQSSYSDFGSSILRYSDADANVNVTGQLYAASFTAVNNVNVAAGGTLTASNAAASNQAQAMSVTGTANIAGGLTVVEQIRVGTSTTAGALTAGATSANQLLLVGGAFSTANLASYATTGTSPTIDVGATTTLTVGAGGHGSVTNTGTFTVDGSALVGALSGAGGVTVVNSSLTADSIVQNTLTIGAGGVVTIRETTGGSVSSVPEPGTWALLAAGAACLLPLVRRLRRRD